MRTAATPTPRPQPEWTVAPRIRVAALLLVGLGAWLALPSSRLARTAPVSASSAHRPYGFERFAALPVLSGLQHAGELPSDEAMKRDPFLFEAPSQVIQTPSGPVQATAPPLPAALPTAPREVRELRYLGFLRGAPAGLLGAFMRGGEAETITPGSVLAGWRLEEVGETAAVFQSIQFPDLQFTLHAKGDS